MLPTSRFFEGRGSKAERRPCFCFVFFFSLKLGSDPRLSGRPRRAAYNGALGTHSCTTAVYCVCVFCSLLLSLDRSATCVRPPLTCRVGAISTYHGQRDGLELCREAPSRWSRRQLPRGSAGCRRDIIFYLRFVVRLVYGYVA